MNLQKERVHQGIIDRVIQNVLWLVKQNNSLCREERIERSRGNGQIKFPKPA